MTVKRKTTPSPEPTGTTRRAPAKSPPGAGLAPSHAHAAQPVTGGEGVTRGPGGPTRTSTPASGSAITPARVPASAPRAPVPSLSSPLSAPLSAPGGDFAALLTPNEAKVLLAYFDSDQSVTNADIATRTGISERSIYRMWKRPHFKALYQEMVTNKIERSASRRVDTLVTIATDPKNRNAVMASKLLFQLEGKLVNMHAVMSKDETDQLLAKALGCRVDQLPAPDAISVAAGAGELDKLGEQPDAGDLTALASLEAIRWFAGESAEDGDGDGDGDGYDSGGDGDGDD